MAKKFMKRLIDGFFFVKQLRFLHSMYRQVSFGFSFLFLIFGLSSTVMLSIPSHAQELRDVRPPVEVSEFPWLWVLVGLLLLGVLAKLFIDWRNRPKAKPSKESWVIASERLDALHKQGLSSKGEFKIFFTELSIIIRAYLEQRFNIRAPEMTTQEFLESMKNSTALLQQHKDILKELLQTADMVKFAQHEPDSERSALCFDLARRLIDETKIVTSNSSQKSKSTQKN